jgi:hypothetical protein
VSLEAMIMRPRDTGTIRRAHASCGLGLFTDTCLRMPHVMLGSLLVYLVLLVPLTLPASRPSSMADLEAALNITIRPLVPLTALISFYSVVTAFSWTFDRQATNLYGALPVRRRTQFLALLLASVAAPLIGLLVAWLVSCAILGFGPNAAPMVPWLGVQLLLVVAFCGLSVLCAQVTGRAGTAFVCFLMAGVYAEVMRQLGYALYYLVSPTFGFLLQDSHATATWLSPLARLYQLSLHITGAAETPAPWMSQLWQALGAYALVGTICMGVAAWLFGHRDLERAGDGFVFLVAQELVVALLSLAMGAGLTCMLFFMVIGAAKWQLSGVPAPLICLAATAFTALSYATITSVAQRSIRSVRKHVPVLATTTSIALVASIALGWVGTSNASYIPPASKIKSATMSELSMPITSKSAIKSLRDLHAKLNEARTSSYGVTWKAYSSFDIAYQMKDGSSVIRSYSLPCTEDGTILDTDAAIAVRRFEAEGALDANLRQSVSSMLSGKKKVWVSVDCQDPSSGTDASYRVSSSDYADLREKLDADISRSGAARIVSASDDSTLYLTMSRVSPPKEDSSITVVLSNEVTPSTLAWLRERYATTMPALLG